MPSERVTSGMAGGSGTASGSVATARVCRVFGRFADHIKPPDVDVGQLSPVLPTTSTTCLEQLQMSNLFLGQEAPMCGPGRHFFARFRVQADEHVGGRRGRGWAYLALFCATACTWEATRKSARSPPHAKRGRDERPESEQKAATESVAKSRAKAMMDAAMEDKDLVLAKVDDDKVKRSLTSSQTNSQSNSGIQKVLAAEKAESLHDVHRVRPARRASGQCTDATHNSTISQNHYWVSAGRKKWPTTLVRLYVSTSVADLFCCRCFLFPAFHKHAPLLLLWFLQLTLRYATPNPWVPDQCLRSCRCSFPVENHVRVSQQRHDCYGRKS